MKMVISLNNMLINQFNKCILFFLNDAISKSHNQISSSCLNLLKNDWRWQYSLFCESANFYHYVTSSCYLITLFFKNSLALKRIWNHLFYFSTLSYLASHFKMSMNLIKNNWVHTHRLIYYFLKHLKWYEKKSSEKN